MGLRITPNISINRALFNINRNTMALNRIREQLSTGMRINRPSDDPTAFLRMLPIKSNKANLIRFQENADLASDILNTASSAFQDAVQVLSRAKEMAIQGANGSLSPGDRKTLASTINQLLKEMLSLANSRLGDRYLFSGTATLTNPFVLKEDASGSFVEYKGDSSEVTVEIAPGTEMAVSSAGDEFFMTTNRTATAILGTTGASPGSGTDSGRGMALLQIENTGLSGLPAGLAAGSGSTTALGTLNYSITSGPPDTISINGGPAVALTGSNIEVLVGSTNDKIYLDASSYVSAGSTSGTFQSTARMSWDGGQSWTNVDFTSTNQQVFQSGNGHVLNLDSTGIVRVGTDQVTFGGTFDAFNVLVALRDLLENDQGLEPFEVSQRITSFIGEVDSVLDNLLEGLRDLGARGSQIELTRNRMSRLELTMEEALSRERDIDISEVILRMSQKDTGYQASLAVGARVITQSLLDFI